MNLTNNTVLGCDEDVPPSEVFFANITVAEKTIVVICGLLTSITLALFLELVIFALRHYNADKHIKYRSIQVLATYPVVALASCVALCIPRANVISCFFSSVYIAIAMHSFIALMFLYYGGQEAIPARFHNASINLRSPPCCCCCPCLPSLPVNKKNLQVIKLLVLQNALVQPILSSLAVVMWMDGKYIEGKLALDNSFSYLNCFNTVSTLLSLYGFLICNRLLREHLRPAHILPKFLSFQLVVVFNRVQVPLFSTLAQSDIPRPREPLSSSVLGQAYMQMLCICEMCLLLLVARPAFRRVNGHEAGPPKAEDVLESQGLSDSTKTKLSQMCEMNGKDKDAILLQSEAIHSRETNL